MAGSSRRTVWLNSAASKPLRQTTEETTAWTILRGEDADARSVTKLIDVIEDVDRVKAHGRRLHPRDRHFRRDTGIDLRVRRHMPGIGKTRAQTATIDHT